MKCSKCGAQNPDEVTFCTECGESLAKPVNAKMKIDPAKKKKWIRIGAAIVGIIAAILILLVVFRGNEAEDTAIDFCDSLKEMDLNGAMELLPPAFLENIAHSLDLENAEYEVVSSDEMSDADIAELNSRYSQFGAEDNYIESGYKVRMRAKVSGKAVSRDEIVLYMVEIDGDWYLEPLMTLEELDEAEIYDDAFIINWGVE